MSNLFSDRKDKKITRNHLSAWSRTYCCERHVVKLTKKIKRTEKTRWRLFPLLSSRPSLRRLATAIVCVLCVFLWKELGPRGGQPILSCLVFLWCTAILQIQFNRHSLSICPLPIWRRNIDFMFECCWLGQFDRIKVYSTRVLERNVELTNRWVML